MKHWIIFAGITVGLLLYATQHHNDRSLAAAKAETKVAIAATQHALEIASAQQQAAAWAEHRADSIAKVRAVAAPKRAAVVAAAPDTCKPAIAALEADKASLTAEVAEARSALDAQKQAAGALKPAAQNLTQAATKLEKKSGGSFWKDITPKLGFGGAAGIDPIDHSFHPVIGVTLSWSF